MLENSMPKEAVYHNIHDKPQLDSIPKLNMTSIEEECNKFIMESINKNYVDMDESQYLLILPAKSQPGSVI